jgi:hypothetical protein
MPQLSSVKEATMTKPASAPRKPSRVAARDVLSSEAWEEQLEMMGGFASLEDMQAHLNRAPDPNSPNARYLAGVISESILRTV